MIEQTDRRPRAVRLAPAAEPADDHSPLTVPASLSATPPTAAAPAALAVEITADPFATAAPDREERAVEVAQKRGIFQRSLLSWAGLFWSALSGLVSLTLGLWVAGIVENAFARAPALGVAGLVLAGLAGLALLAMGAREAVAVGRQRHIARLHAAIARAHAGDDRDAARTLVRTLVGLYQKRPETARARREILALRAEIVDGRDLLDIAERTLLRPLDRQATAAVADAARRVAAVTTLAPRAIIDVVFVLLQAVRLIRLVSVIYGGRPGLLGFLKLARSVGAHLAITGGMAAGDTVLQQVVGHGVAAKISARLGESILNGLLTARIGLSAVAVCRPMPFAAEPTPTLRKVVPFLFRAPRGSGADEAPTSRKPR